MSVSGDNKPPSIELAEHAAIPQKGEVVPPIASAKEIRRVLWKIDLILLPMLAICYMFQFLDKMSLNYASLLGMLEDTKLVGAEYSWTASVFYFGYFAASYLAAYLVVRLPIGKYLAATVVVWAVVLACTAAAQNFDHLVAVRFFLGATEAGVAPGFSLVTGMWYTREEQPLRHGLWFAGNCIANLFGGLFSYGIGHIDGPMLPWRYLFIIFGVGTFVTGVVMLVFMPDHPNSAIWLTKREREIATHRVLSNQTGIKNNTFKLPQVVEALRDPKTWFITLYTFCVNIPNGGLTSFGSLVIEGFGYEGLDALLIQMPSGAGQLGFVISSSLLCTYVPNARLVTMFCLLLVSIAGITMMFAIDEGAENRQAKMAGYCLSMAFVANLPMSLSLIASNTGGFTKKSIVTGLTFVAYCVGNLVGPQFFSVDEAPTYPRGIRASLAGFCIAAFFLVGMRVYLQWENARRDKKYGTVNVNELTEEEIAENSDDKTDWEVTTFRYVL